MSYRTVEPARGVEWIKNAAVMEFKNPLVFLVSGFICLVIFIVPAALGRAGIAGAVLGQLLMAFLMPLLLAGFLKMFRTQEDGGSADIGQLFWAFQDQSKLVPLLMLGIPSAAASLVGLILGFALPAALVLLIALALNLGVFGLVLFALPRVAFDGREPIPSMIESIQASLANIMPLLVFLGIMLGVMLVLIVLSVILAFLGFLGWAILALLYLALFIVGLPWSAGVTYAAYVDVFGAGPTTPPPPPA